MTCYTLPGFCLRQYNNAGYTVTFSRNLKATTVRLVKIDAGEVFGFSKPYNRFTNTLAAKSGKQQNGGGFFGFEDPRDIQLGNAVRLVVVWHGRVAKFSCPRSNFCRPWLQ